MPTDKSTARACTLFAPWRLAWRERALLVQLTRRDIAGRYRGSMLGLAWSFVAPLTMLAIYTFVFGSVFKARWYAHDEGGALAFALYLFAGLIVFNLFTEVLTRTPGLIAAHVNYVKKTVFPLALLPLATLLSALFHAFVSLTILLAALTLMGKSSALWALLVPVWLPLLFFLLGLGWLLAALGAYLRDLGQLSGMAASAVLFLSPVFYPVSALPEELQAWLWLNPLTVPIEATRAVLIDGVAPNWTALAVYLIAAGLWAWLGWVVFERLRPGFADVL